MRDRSNLGYIRIDVPKDKLFTCFYCGEIATEWDHVPPVSRYHDYYALYNRHKPILVPSCSECNRILSDSMQRDVYERFTECKVKLTKRLGKYIRYGEIWSEESIEYSGFTGTFQKFAEGVTQMKEIADYRLKWQHWPVTIDGETIGNPEEVSDVLKVGNKTFARLDHLYEHARKVDKIPTKYLEAVIRLLGVDRLDFCYKFCKVNPIKSEADLKSRLIDLQEMLDEEKK